MEHSNNGLSIATRRSDVPLVHSDQLTFTVVATSNKQPLAKQFSLDKTDRLTTKTAATLTRGSVTVEHAAALSDFAKRLDQLGTHQAVVYGVSPMRRAKVVTQAQFAKLTTAQRKGVITRTREYLQFASAPGVMMLDFDAGVPEDLLPALASPDKVRDLLTRAAPELADAPMMWRPSSSSYLFKGKREVHGLRGQRIYIALARASDIPRLGEVLYERLWLCGYGYFVVSASGQLLDRTVVDGAVWQPERLDFAAGPICVRPLTRRAPKARLWNTDATFFDARRVASLSPQEERSIATKRNAARTALREAARARREAWAKERGKQIVARNGTMQEDAAVAVAHEAVEHGVLRPDFLLITEDGRSIPVRELLEHPDVWHEKRFCDPLEPDYRDDHRIAFANLRPGNGRPYLYSHAHGGVRYTLADVRPTIRLVQGDLPVIVDALAEIITAEGEVFQLKDEIVHLTREGRFAPVTPEWVSDYLQRRADFERFLEKRHEWAPTDLQAKYAKTLLAKRGELSLPGLVALTAGPFLRPDGTVVDQPGYDATTQVLYQPSGPYAPAVRKAVTPAMAEEALRYLWGPFSKFPFANDVDRGVILALLLTAATRPGIAIAPAGLIESHDAGSGKTLAAQAIANLTGVPAAPQAMALSEEELRKALFAVARAGTPALFFDNVARERPVDSASLAMALTSGMISDRILGESTVATVPFRSLMLLTGNNVRIVGDLNRRILRARITPNIEHPWKRVFAFCPRARTEASWLDMRVAALEIVQAALGHGSASLPDGSGYPNWDHLVRKPVCWVAEHLDIGVGFDDPAKTLLSGFEDDPERDRLRRLLTAWHGAFGAEARTVAQVIDAFDSAPLSPHGETLNAKQEAVLLLEEVVREIDHYRAKHKVGIYLSQQKGRIVDGLELINAGHRSGVSLWSVRRQNATGAAA